MSAQAPSCDYVFLKCILCKGEDQPEAVLQGRAMEIDAVSVLESRLFLKGTSVCLFILQTLFSSLKNEQTLKKIKTDTSSYRCRV